MADMPATKTRQRFKEFLNDPYRKHCIALIRMINERSVDFGEQNEAMISHIEIMKHSYEYIYYRDLVEN